MNHPTLSQKHIEFLLTILFLQFMACITILMGVPVARQAIGFIYVTFVPGIALIKLLKMKMNGLAETLLFATGLSVASLMLIGLFVNQLNPLVGVLKPLSLSFLLPAINIFVLTCAIVAYLRGENEDAESFTSKVKNPLIIFPLLCIPALSIVGAMISGSYGDNRILLFTIVAIAAVFTAATISRKAVFTRLYPFLVVIIAISLIYHSALISERIISFGSDVGGEVFAQKIVEKNAYWNPVNPFPWDQSVGRTYAMLSVTLLPTIYSVLLDLDVVLVFKLFYAIFLTLVPLGIYNLWKNFVGEKLAFVSAFFFMAFQPFYGELLGLNKQILGELFLVLLLTSLLSEGKGWRLQKNVCLIIFSFGLIVSHYALAEIFLFFSVFVLISSMITRRPSRKITVTFVLTFFTVMFAWYLFTSSSTVFESFISFGERVINELNDFFNLQSREPEVLRGLGLEPPPTIWNMLSRIFFYVTEILIVIGFISVILKRNKVYLDKDSFLLVFCSMLLLGALIAVPGLSSTMNMTRFYHILLFFLAPLCTLGAETVINVVSKRNSEIKALILLLVVLVPLFLFQTNFVYEITGSDSWSVSLSNYRMSPLRMYQVGYSKKSYDAYGQWWLSSNVIAGRTPIYCDPFSDLRCYALIYQGYPHYLSKVVPVAVGGVVYLSSLSVVYGDYVALYSSWNVSEIQFLYEMSKVYTNGETEILCKNG
ncbi:MAG: DUF2206 domain-containing protein [Candidatus Bathyarchaeia archaeon]